MSDQNVSDQRQLPGWVVESRRSHYTIGYWLKFVLGMLGQMVPDPPRITYALRNISSGERRSVTLAGDHSPAELAAVTHTGSAPAIPG